MTNNTIFDDVFRTIVEKMTYLIVPLINEVFHTSYPEDVKIMHLRNEHQPYKHNSCMSAYCVDAQKMADAVGMQCWTNDGKFRYFSQILFRE